MREFFTIAIFKIKADIRMNKTTLNSQKEKHSMPSLRRATRPGQRLQSVTGFLSTLSLRRATFQGPGLVRHGVDFYPRSPCGERPRSRKISTRPCQFLSTLSLRRATSSCTSRERATLFLSTLSLRRATGGYKALGFDTLISIHALLAESDGWPSRPSCGPCGYFYPRSPCGERQEHTLACPAGCLFLSTLSLRRATATFNIDAFALYISIHALLAESDIGRA